MTGRKGEGARERGDAPLRAPPFSLAFNLASVDSRAYHQDLGAPLRTHALRVGRAGSTGGIMTLPFLAACSVFSLLLPFRRAMSGCVCVCVCVW